MKALNEILNIQQSPELRSQIKVVLAMNRRDLLKEAGTTDEVSDRVSFAVAAAKDSGAIENELAWMIVTSGGFDAAVKEGTSLPDEFVTAEIGQIVNEPAYVRGLIRLSGGQTAEDRKAAELAVKL